MEHGEINKPPDSALVLVTQEERLVTWNARDVVAAGFRQKRAIVYCMSAIVLLGLLSALFIPREYQSEAKILLTRERTDLSTKTGKSEERERITDEDLNSEAELIRSNDLLRTMVLQTGLAREGQSERDIARAIRQARSALTVEPIRKTDVLSITYTAQSPDLAAKVVNKIVALYLDKHVAVHSVPGEFEFFDRQVAQYRDQMEKAQAALAQFSQGSNGTVSPATQREALLQKQSEFNGMLQQARSGIAETQARIRTLEKEATTTPSRMTRALRTADNPQLMEALKATLLNLKLKRTELLSKYQPTYRPVQDVEQQIAQTEAAIAAAQSAPIKDETTDVNPTHEWVDSELAKARAELRSLESRAASLSGAVETYDQQAQHMDAEQIKYADLVRNAKTAEDNYLLYVNKREEARIDTAMDKQRILNVSVIEPTVTPYLPKHSGLFYFGIALMLLPFVTAGVVFMLEHLDNTVHTPRDLEHWVQVPVLAAVPVEHRLAAGMTPHSRLRELQ
jgi:uncharacterized protein involved in exopolysaccharide biosynthesis